MKLYIKNMVCDRCKMVVKNELIKFGLHPITVELGEVSISEEITREQKKNLNQILLSLGFVIIDDKKSRIIERIKAVILETVYGSGNHPKKKLSYQICEKLHHDYNSLSSLFSEVEGRTIEQYFIAQKTERVKELLVYDELSISEISEKLNYSSVSHLSKQFKKVTGFTPSHFRQLKEKRRRSIATL